MNLFGCTFVSRTRAMTLLAAAGVVFASGLQVRAESTGENALVIVDPSSPQSMYVANYYRQAREIPDSNFLYMDPAAPDYAAFAEANLDGLFGTLANSGIEDHIDYIIIPPGAPFFISANGYVTDNCVAVHRFALSSAYTMAFLKDDLLNGPVSSQWVNGYSTLNDTLAVAFDSSVAWFGGEPSDNAGARRYFIGAMLGYDGNLGNTIDDTINMIDRSVAADGTRPAGTFYFMDNQNDPDRNVRRVQYSSTVEDIGLFGGQAETILGVLPDGKNDCAGIMTGFANADIEGGNFTVLPGAFCDHLTSWAATFDNNHQTKLSRWIVKGASGSVGAVEEPCNYQGKFPRANTHLHYFKGAALGEAYFRNARFVPFQMLLYGDPLTRAFTYIPTVEVFGAPAEPVSGEIQLLPFPSTDNPQAQVTELDVFIDGLVFQSYDSIAPVVIDTTELADGYHDLRIVVYDNSALRSAGRWRDGLVVNNAGRSASISPDVNTGDLNTAFTFTVSSAGGNVQEMHLVQNGRVVAATDSDSGQFTIFGQTFGAGPVQVQAEAVFDDGMIVRSEPIDLDIAFVTGTPSGQAPVSFSYTKHVLNDQPFVVELPATFDDDLSTANFNIVSAPSQATIHTGATGGYRILVPDAGANGTDELIFNVSTPSGVSADAIVTIIYDSTGLPGDLNGDGCVDQSDLGILLASYQVDGGGDVDGDGDTDQSDLGILLANYEVGC